MSSSLSLVSVAGVCSSLNATYLELSSKVFVGEIPLDSESEVDMKLVPEEIDDNFR